jgi:hypothetical protein
MSPLTFQVDVSSSFDVDFRCELGNGRCELVDFRYELGVRLYEQLVSSNAELFYDFIMQGGGWKRARP